MGNSVTILKKKKLAKQEVKNKVKPTRYRLVYFNIKGRAETSRMLFALAGVHYEDVRIQHEDWPNSPYKKLAPFGQLPVLEIDGTTSLCQQHSIERHLARELGLSGKTPIEQARIDMLTECIRDTMAPIVSIYNEKDDMKKFEVLKRFSADGGSGTLPFFLNFLRQQLMSPWYLGQQISLADVSLYNCFEYLLMFSPNAFDNEPTLRDWHKRFINYPPISDWLSKRPATM